MKRPVIVLGGNNKANEAWVKQLSDELGKSFDTTTLKYKHWQTGDPDIDFDTELARLIGLVENIGGDYSIVAKSAGALLALTGISQGMVFPDKLVCIGLPVIYAKSRDIPLHDLLASNKAPALFIQAKGDPAGSFSEVALLVGDRGAVRKVAGHDHAYTDLDTVVQLATDFIGSPDPGKELIT